MSEELDIITLLFALLGIGIAFKSDIIRAYKNRKIAKEKNKKNSNKKLIFFCFLLTMKNKLFLILTLLTIKYTFLFLLFLLFNTSLKDKIHIKKMLY